MTETELQGAVPAFGELSPHSIEAVLDPVITTHDLVKLYGQGAATEGALRGVSLQLARGQFTAILGSSGSGNSTLLRALVGLEAPTSGEVIFDGTRLTLMKKRRLARLRRDHVGLLFPSPELVPGLTVKENITLPASMARKKLSADHLGRLLQMLSLEERQQEPVSRLSPGQQQRVACARALAGQPTVVLADEPTGNLDSRSARRVLRFLREASQQFQQSIVMATHDAEAALWADRVVFLVDGKIAGELLSPTRQSLLAALQELGDMAEAEPDVFTSPIPWIPRIGLSAPLRKSAFPSPAAEIAATEPALELAPLPPAPPEEPATTSAALPLKEALEQIAPEALLPEETVKMIDQARQILGELPGSVVEDCPRDGPDYDRL